MSFKSGFITLMGRPNTGKSTLMNALSGGKISIISDKPQTTRNIIKSIITTEKYQMIFLDTPGIHKPHDKLGLYMIKQAQEAIKEVDVACLVIDVSSTVPGKRDLFITQIMKDLETPVILVINKIDLVKKEQILSVIEGYRGLMEFAEIIPLSASLGDGVDILKEKLVSYLPDGPKYFPGDMITDQPERFIAAEIIREKLLLLLKDEVPHGTGVEIIQFKELENRDMIEIHANIYCEKDSHKGIIIGKDGIMLKKAGTLARYDIEKLLGVKVFLKLWVKIKPDWRNSNSVLKTLGYK